jgi:hypothetical protein
LDIEAPDLPQPRGMMCALCGGHIRNLVMTGTYACLSLPRFTVFAGIYRRSSPNLTLHTAHDPSTVLAGAAANKFKVSYLNDNLMVPEIPSA